MRGGGHQGTANGELETKTNTANGDEWLFQYDVLGNLVSVGLPNGDLVEYLTDGLKRRVGKKLNGVLVKQWLYRSNLQPAAELDASGNLVALFIHTARTNVPSLVRRGGATYRVISDHLGSPREAVNVNNATDVPFRAEYSPFGEATGTGLDWMPFGFAGGSYDAQVGLVRFGRRDYEPVLGRWVNKDPIGFTGGQANLYVYAANDPVSKRDPSGLAVKLCRRVADLPLNSFFEFEHHFLSAGGVAAGAGVCGGGVPGHGGSDAPYDPMCMNDHSSDVGRSDVICEVIPDADEQCVADSLAFGTPLGPFAPPVNDCQTNALDILQRCRPQTAFPSGGSEGAPGDPGFGWTLGY